MDMRSLNSSLPSSASKKTATQPPENLLQAFKSAALSVTTLYKAAANEQASAHFDGYQAALEDLLGFLDKENIGLDDGEGWRIRQWATERHQGTSQTLGTAESEEDEVEESKPTKEATPPPEREAPRASSPATATTNEPIIASEGPIPSDQPEFTFRSSHPFPQPQDIDMHVSDQPRVKFEIHPRRQSRTHRSNSPRLIRSSTPGLGQAAGSKRKTPLGDFFNLGNYDLKRDGSDGGPGATKRGRMM